MYRVHAKKYKQIEALFICVWNSCSKDIHLLSLKIHTFCFILSKGPARKSSLPERRKQRLATVLKSRRPGIKLPSQKATPCNRRPPPPLPPGAVPVTDKAPSLRVPPLPAVPRPRPSSAYDHTQEVLGKPAVSKSVSESDIHRFTSAEGNAC